MQTPLLSVTFADGAVAAAVLTIWILTDATP